jgi:type II secretory pathway component GspD/PulD (secretin)
MKRKEIKTEVRGRNILLLYLIAVSVTVCAATVQGEPNQTDSEKSVLLDQADSGLIINYQQRSVAEDSFLDQPVQSINFRKNMTVRDALRFLAAKYRRNIIPSAQVTGTLNVTSLYEVTFEQALDAILGSDYRYKATGGFIRVYSAAEYVKLAKDIENMTSRVFELHYINAAEVKALIMPIMSEFSKIASTSAASVDTEAGQSGDRFSMRDTIVVYDFPERLDQIGEMIKKIDVKPQQILIEVTVLKAELSETTEFGINWNRIGDITATSTPLGMSIGLASGIASGTGLAINLTNDEIVSAITALEGVTDTTVLANPKILALNKQAGYINIGEERGYTASTTQGQTTTTSVDFLISGTILKFRPYICDNEYVRMEINPELSTGSIQTEVNSTLPLKTITQVKTNIMVKDGKTIIIAGLFKEQLTSNDSQVPVVGDLPIVGWLFKKTKDTNIRTELIILITPHIINEPEELASASERKMDDIGRIVEGSRKRMSPIARARIYEEIYAKAVNYYADKEYDKALAELNWIIGFRPNALEAVQLKEKILAEVRPDKYGALERIMLDQIRKEQDVMWKRR